MTTDKSASDFPYKGESAINMLRNGVFPEAWRYTPVAGKKPRLKGWDKDTLDKQQCIEAYISERAFNGVGVVTGEQSGGVIALDIDGPDADSRYKEAAGEEYEPYSQERTMAWTSGKAGRRQILYQVPKDLVPQLSHVTTLVRRVDDGRWYQGKKKQTEPAHKPTEAKNPPMPQPGEKEYEELVLRFNGCQSVLPGSVNPDTKKRYFWLNYNDGEVAPAPRWVVDILLSHAKPCGFFTAKQQAELGEEFGQTSIPSPQIRGWFFKDEVQQLLMPRLEDLIFKHQTFDQYGWKTRPGDEPQRMSGCPWHGGRSGESFQYSPLSGVWICHACQVGGDVLDFVHKIRTNNKDAGKPYGPDLEVYVSELAKELGFDYPACAKAIQVTTKEVPVKRLTGHEFFTEAERIDDTFDNAELGDYHLMELVRDAGLSNVYRSGPQVRAALERFKLHEEQVVDDPDWQQKVRGEREYLIPDFISRPSSIMLHARGGMGKTRIAVLLSKIVGQKLPMKVRGMTVEPTTSGNVLFIGNDMSMTDYAEYFDQQGIDSSGPDRWMKFKPHWQQSQYKVLLRWLEELKPVLVVVDSLTSVSTMIAAKEYEKEYANTLYRLARENGTAFPATTFLWIHHNTKDGTKFRGTDTLRNAVHETWELKDLTDEQRAEFGDSALILEIDKSRGMRGGDRFLIREDIEEALSIEDLTPTVTRENGGQGDETPRTLVLGILKEAEAPMTVKEVRYELNSRLSGRRGPGTCVSQRTVERWLKHWEAAGLVEPTSVRQPGQGRGRPSTAFRVLSLICEAKSVVNSAFFSENASRTRDLICDRFNDTPHSEAPGVVNSEAVSPESDETQSEALEAPKGLTEIEAPQAPEAEPGINDTPGEKTTMSQNPVPETRSSTGIPENETRICDTEPGIKGESPSEWSDPDWGPLNLG